MIMWVRNTDLCAAITAAKIAVSPDKKLLADAAFAAMEVAQASIAQALSPSLPALDAQATALGEIERGCGEAVAAMSGVSSHDDARTMAEPTDPRREAAGVLAEALLNVDRLRSWAVGYATTARI